MRLHEDAQVKCNQCNARFAFEPSLQNHVSKDFYNEMNKTRKCPHCEERFSNYLAFKYHLSKTHKVMIVPKPKHSCHECNFETRNKSYLLIHIKTIHKGEKPFECIICNAKFTTRPNWKRHRGAFNNYVDRIG